MINLKNFYIFHSHVLFDELNDDKRSHKRKNGKERKSSIYTFVFIPAFAGTMGFGDNFAQSLIIGGLGIIDRQQVK
jgi:hypothetical protein